MTIAPNQPIGVIGAMKTEVDDLSARMTDVTVETICGMDFVSGLWEGRRIVAAVSGVGKVFSAVCAQTMILRYSPSLIVNIGVAGGLSPTLKIGDVAVANAVVQHDMDTTALGDEPGLLSGLNRVYLPCTEEITHAFERAADSLGLHHETGVIASGDVFVHTTEQKQLLRERFNAIACEMEGGSIGTVCFKGGIDFCVVRTISDGGDENAPMDFPAAMRTATLAAQNLLYAFLRQLNA